MLAESTSAQLEENEPPSVATPPPPTTTTTESESEVVETTDDDSNQQAIMLTDRDNICTSDDPCNVCEGDCLGNDASCSGDLECFYRPTGDNTRVPGCFGAGQAGISYCWVPIEETLVMRSPTRPPCSSRQPCDKCEGSCQQDVDCFDGLSCTERLEDLTLVPGCGNGFAGLNFCFDPAEDKSSKKDDNKGRNAGIHSPTTRRRRHLLRGERRS